MFQIADRVFAFGDVDGLVRHHLDVLSVEDAVILFRDHVRDPGLAGVEIVPDLLHVESLSPLSHLRLAFPLLGQTVVGSSREDCPGGHVILHVISLQLDVVVRDLDIAPVVHLALPVREILSDRILRPGECRSGKGTLVQHEQRVSPGCRIRDPDGVSSSCKRVLKRRNRIRQTDSGIIGNLLERVRQRNGFSSLPKAPVPPQILSEHCQSRQRGQGRYEDNIICMLLELQLFYKFAKDKYTTYFGFTSQFSCRNHGLLTFRGRILRLGAGSVRRHQTVNCCHRPWARRQGRRLCQSERKNHGKDNRP